MLQDAFAGFERQIEAIEIRITLFEHVDNAQTLQVVLESAKCRHAGIERVLPGVAERRMTQIMCQGHRLDQVFVQAQRPADRPPQLRHLQRMGQTGPKQVTLVVQKNLGLVDQAPKRRAVDDPVPIALEVGARRCNRLGVPAPTRKRRITGINGQSHEVRRPAGSAAAPGGS